MTRSDDTPVPDYQAMLRLDGRRFVLIGAGQGIGRQAAHALSGAGARVFCVDVDDGVADIVGIARFIELPDVTDDDWDWFFAMNLRHAFLALQIGSRAMTDGGV